MNADDPFGLENDAGRTRIRPVRRAAQPAPRRAGPAATGTPLRTARASDNPLLNAYAALLGMAPELERATAPENPDVLRTRLLETLTQARDSAVSAGVPLSRADQGAWFVAALLDDIALNTPWGGHSGWPRMPLVVSMYGNVDAGERFFDLAEDLIRFPERDPQLLELVFLCLSLGFRGKHRINPGAGEAAIAQMRVQMNRLLRDRDAADAPLAPHWKGVEAADESRGFIVPLWSIGLMAIALIMVVYVGLGIQLSNRGERLFTLASVLPPPERADIFRPIIETVEQPLLTADPLVFELLPLFAEAAPKDTASALTGREDVSIAIVVVQATNPEVFRSAKADLNAGYSPLIASVAQVIRDNAEFIGSVRVVGHTDSIPVQRSNPFRSNQGLSEARAKTIADMLVQAGVPAGLVASEGKAATEPIADNGTKPGRARNRRVEIILQKKV
ncbi:type IVB secretion system protein IcmH/DotU [Puniceibacterium sp. IMCC21224]|uniref:type IVB secretion system protein IcmH/DotU n=1 Tax=Puniceibacterium sp. IMCC21224 TaxID=1618204 RepID=UPI00064DBCD2|nr:type IVB secretion system protein IcmH/DotU [Puniceibacterium sp. IMCC21224]KMK65228.1 type IV / VI secretion system protein, DotU family [Puniceibacterium sp. IMCC21224]